MKYLLTITWLLILSTLSFAQASIEIGAGAHLNNPSGQQDFFYQLTVVYRFKDYAVGIDVYGDPSKTNPKQPARVTTFATYKFAEWAGWNMSGGPTAFKWGNEVGGGAVFCIEKRLLACAAYGSQ